MSQTNENATVAKTKNFSQLNKALDWMETVEQMQISRSLPAAVRPARAAVRLCCACAAGCRRRRGVEALAEGNQVYILRVGC